MAETLASLTDKVELYLLDTSNKSWPAASIEIYIRMALADINQAVGVTYAIKDLDAAPATTLLTKHIPILIMGAAAYAARSRQLDRLEKVDVPGVGTEATFGDWGTWQMNLFQKRLEDIRTEGIHGATTAPHTASDWEEEPKTW